MEVVILKNSDIIKGENNTTVMFLSPSFSPVLYIKSEVREGYDLTCSLLSSFANADLFFIIISTSESLSLKYSDGFSFFNFDISLHSLTAPC